MFQRKKWTSQEQWVLRLLLDGETNLMESLRRQLEPPFFCRVYRHVPRGKACSDATQHTYRFDIVFNEALLGEFSVGDGVNFQINDLRIRDHRVEGEIQIAAEIREGVITEIRAASTKAISWPKYLRADDWWFVLDTDKGPWRSKRRQSLKHLGRIVQQEKGSQALLDLPVATPLDPREDGDRQDGQEDEQPDLEASGEQAARQVAQSIASDPQAGRFDQLVDEITAEGRDEIPPGPGPVNQPSQPSQQEVAQEAGESKIPAGAENPAPPEPFADEAPDRLGLASDELEGLAEDDEDEADAGPGWAADDIRSAVAEFDDALEEETDESASRPTGLSMSWVESFVQHAFDAGEGISLNPPAQKSRVEALRRELSVSFPSDLLMFLSHADGGNLWGVTVLSSNDILSLEEEDEAGRVVFALAQEGGSYALDLSRADADSTAPVIFQPRRGGQEAQVAPSFRAWLDYVEDRAQQGQPF